MFDELWQEIQDMPGEIFDLDIPELKDDETFGPVVPFYIVQILYIHKDYHGILEVAPALLK